MDARITSSFSNLTCRYYAYTRKSCNNKSDLSVYLNSIKLEDVTISEIRLNPKDKSTYSGSITVIANMKNFNVGDTMTIQTSTNNYSIIKGTITGRDFFINTLYFSHIEVLTL